MNVACGWCHAPRLMGACKKTIKLDENPKFFSIVFLIPDEVSKLRGESVVLTCPIDVTSCGELHSVKWFKGNERVAVVSGDGTVENVESQYSGR